MIPSTYNFKYSMLLELKISCCLWGGRGDVKIIKGDFNQDWSWEGL